MLSPSSHSSSPLSSPMRRPPSPRPTDRKQSTRPSTAEQHIKPPTAQPPSRRPVCTTCDPAFQSGTRLDSSKINAVRAQYRHTPPRPLVTPPSRLEGVVVERDCGEPPNVPSQSTTGSSSPSTTSSLPPTPPLSYNSSRHPRSAETLATPFTVLSQFRSPPPPTATSAAKDSALPSGEQVVISLNALLDGRPSCVSMMGDDLGDAAFPLPPQAVKIGPSRHANIEIEWGKAYKGSNNTTPNSTRFAATTTAHASGREAAGPKDNKASRPRKHPYASATTVFTEKDRTFHASSNFPLMLAGQSNEGFQDLDLSRSSMVSGDSAPEIASSPRNDRSDPSTVAGSSEGLPPLVESHEMIRRRRSAFPETPRSSVSPSITTSSYTGVDIESTKSKEEPFYDLPRCIPHPGRANLPSPPDRRKDSVPDFPQSLRASLASTSVSRGSRQPEMRRTQSNAPTSARDSSQTFEWWSGSEGSRASMASTTASRGSRRRPSVASVRRARSNQLLAQSFEAIPEHPGPPSAVPSSACLPHSRYPSRDATPDATPEDARDAIIDPPPKEAPTERPKEVPAESAEKDEVQSPAATDDKARTRKTKVKRHHHRNFRHAIDAIGEGLLHGCDIPDAQLNKALPPLPELATTLGAQIAEKQAEPKRKPKSAESMSVHVPQQEETHQPAYGSPSSQGTVSNKAPKSCLSTHRKETTKGVIEALEDGVDVFGSRATKSHQDPVLLYNSDDADSLLATVRPRSPRGARTRPRPLLPSGAQPALSPGQALPTLAHAASRDDFSDDERPAAYAFPAFPSPKAARVLGLFGTRSLTLSPSPTPSGESSLPEVQSLTSLKKDQGIIAPFRSLRSKMGRRPALAEGQFPPEPPLRHRVNGVHNELSRVPREKTILHNGVPSHKVAFLLPPPEPEKPRHAFLRTAKSVFSLRPSRPANTADHAEVAKKEELPTRASVRKAGAASRAA